MKDTSLSDGSRLSAAQVLAAWRGRPAVLRNLGIDSVIATGNGTLAVGVRRDGAGAPGLFGEPALAIVSGATVSPGSNGSFLEHSPSGPTVLDFVSATGDLRDALDTGIDLLVTHDVQLAEYAAQIRELEIFPLPWSRTYVLVQPGGAQPLLSETDSLRAALARDAVKADARPAETSPCPIAESEQTGAGASPRILYSADDPVAQGLAERIVALNANVPVIRAQGLDGAAFAAAVRSGADRGYVTAVIKAAGGTCSTLEIPVGGTLHPLIQTRARAVVRRGSPGLTVDWDGTPRLAQ